MKFGVIISAGFKEATKGGGVLQYQVVQAAREEGMRIVGPNCLGCVNASQNLVAAASLFTSWKNDGSAFVAQSG